MALTRRHSWLEPRSWTDPWSSWTLPGLADMHQRLDSLTRDLFGGEGNGSSQLFFPMDVLSRGDDLVVRAELPGVDPNDIEVQVQDGALTISGQRREQQRQEGDRYFHHELRYGSFLRSVPLPAGVDEDNIQASYDDGVLEVIVPAAKSGTGAKKVPIHVGGKLKKALSRAPVGKRKK